ncbi:GNAT family N-acetyltransferase [Microbaculum marinum]|uniref:GNAT family N-acetyltransferase n=1 Tax=Microbaculum marinum TaxID=1764581 RepID=A0AAW9S375_9HYPH
MPSSDAPNTEPRGESGPYGFRPVTAGDLALLRGWLQAPHFAEWWGQPDGVCEFEAAIACPATEPMIVELDGRPIAYLQCYDPHLEDGHPYRDQPRGTLGFDLSIGPAGLVGRGHGSAMLRQAVETRFASGMRRAVIDPNPGNSRAIAAYRKAGFRTLERRSTTYGEVLLMAQDAPKQDGINE